MPVCGRLNYDFLEYFAEMFGFKLMGGKRMIYLFLMLFLSL